MTSQRLNITLDGEHASKLARLAARVHVNEGTLARSLGRCSGSRLVALGVLSG